ncbi:hypothetical protein HanIR_Chr07g0332791 [Helianthus annuus]|nr:hypothetical protein HanIR_Chr07g0332791 [Helianthus annuus]
MPNATSTCSPTPCSATPITFHTKPPRAGPHVLFGDRRGLTKFHINRNDLLTDEEKLHLPVVEALGGGGGD